MFGKSWESPQNIDLGGSINFNYGYKQKKTIGGKTISQMNYYKQNKWGKLDAWELSEPNAGYNPESRSGIRSWSVRMSFLQESKVLPQNAMKESNAWMPDDNSEYETAGAFNESLYNSSDGIDFYTSVIKPTMGGHLSTVVRISESNNPDQWAIVRIKKLKIVQKNPKFIDISFTLEEQV